MRTERKINSSLCQTKRSKNPTIAKEPEKAKNADKLNKTKIN